MSNFWKLLKKTDKAFLVFPLCFAALSILMISSVSYKGSFILSRDVIIQAAAYVIGFFAMFAVLIFGYHRFDGFNTVLYIGSILFLLTVYLPGLGVVAGGARSWINLGITTFQPSELVKITFTILMANYLSARRGSLATFKGVLTAGLYAAPFILIVVKEDLGSAIVFCFIWLFMIFYAGIDYGVFAKFAAVFVVSLPFAYKFMASYQKSRIDAFLHPSNLDLPGNYHVWNSKVAIGSGGVTGKGLFHGTQKSLNYLPVQKSDFIFSVIVEELGMLGGAALIVLFAFLLYRIAKVVYSAKDLYGALIAIGFIGMFLFQVFENIAMTMGIMPVTGITLPFISYGGSSVISGMIAIGFISSVDLNSR